MARKKRPFKLPHNFGANSVDWPDCHEPASESIGSPDLPIFVQTVSCSSG